MVDERDDRLGPGTKLANTFWAQGGQGKHETWSRPRRQAAAGLTADVELEELRQTVGLDVELEALVGNVIAEDDMRCGERLPRDRIRVGPYGVKVSGRRRRIDISLALQRPLQVLPNQEAVVPGGHLTQERHPRAVKGHFDRPFSERPSLPPRPAVDSARLIESKLPEIEALCRGLGARRLDLFGSAVGDSFDVDVSDVDVLDTHTGFDYFDRYFNLKEGLEQILRRPVDVVVSSSIRNPYFRDRVMHTREILYAA